MNEHDLYRVMKDIDRKYTDELHQYAAELAATKRRRTMKQNTKKGVSAAQIILRKIGVGAAVTACAVIAASIGGGIISLDKQMQVGSNVGTSVMEQISEREPIEITDYRIEGFDVVMGVPETGTAQLLHTVEDAQPWVELVRQNGEYGRSTGEGAEDFRALLENEEIYQDYDVIMTAVPYQFVYQDSGVAMYGFDGGTVTPGGSLTVEMRFLTVGNAMPERIFQQIDTFCCCFAVPKNTVPEITAFTFHDVIYDCTSPLPDGCDTREAHLDYLYSLPNYQEFMGKELTAKYLRFAKDDIQTAEESQSESIPPEGCTEVQSADVTHEPVEIIEKLISSGGNDSTMMKLPPEGAVQVLHSVEDAEACCRYSSENVAGEPFDFRNKLTEDVFAEYDVLYFAFKDGQKPQYCYSVDLAGGCIAADGSTLKLDFHALMFDPAHLPSDWCSVTEPDWNTYYFYTVPKNTLPDLNAIELSFEEYPLGEIPDEILANPHENVGVTDDGKTIMALQKYLETTKEYLDWLNSVPKPKYISWEDNTQLP